MARRLTTKERGYGPEHRKLRALWVKRVKRGGVTCCLCQQEILSWQPFHLDHDVDRTRYRGCAHVYCNESEPGKRRRRRTSTHWRNREYP
jgi:hypothetical protein